MQRMKFSIFSPLVFLFLRPSPLLSLPLDSAASLSEVGTLFLYGSTNEGKKKSCCRIGLYDAMPILVDRDRIGLQDTVIEDTDYHREGKSAEKLDQTTTVPYQPLDILIRKKIFVLYHPVTQLVGNLRLSSKKTLR